MSNVCCFLTKSLSNLMRCFLGMLLILLCSCSSTPRQLVFEETFSGNSLDRTRWSTELKVFGQVHSRYHNYQYLCFLSDSCVIVNNGLWLVSRRQPTWDRVMGIRHDYTSGLISTHDSFAFTYGRIDVVAWYPTGAGVWPAFWLMPQDGSWPPEFDVAEYYGGAGWMHMGLCYGNFPEIQWSSDANNDVSFSTGWHEYSLEWSPGRAQWIQDGCIKRTLEGSMVPSKPMYIILSNGVSSRFGPAGKPNTSTPFPNALRVASVRVWQ